MTPPVSASPPSVALGSFLRSRRERLDPDALGLSSVRRRRTPGLRREEVAEAAGISLEWYVKLEQGRTVTPPERTVEALACALRLDRVDRAHLRRLTNAGTHAPFVREETPPALARMIERLPFPAYVTGRRWDVLAWNAAARSVFGDFGATPVADRNILLFALTDPAAKLLFGPGWAAEAKRIVALFRSTFDLFSREPTFAELVDRVRAGCPSFDAWWADHDIRAPSSGTKVLYTSAGAIAFEHISFQANDDPALKLAVYTPV